MHEIGMLAHHGAAPIISRHRQQRPHGPVQPYRVRTAATIIGGDHDGPLRRRVGHRAPRRGRNAGLVAQPDEHVLGAEVGRDRDARRDRARLPVGPCGVGDDGDSGRECGRQCQRRADGCPRGPRTTRPLPRGRGRRETKRAGSCSIACSTSGRVPSSVVTSAASLWRSPRKRDPAPAARTTATACTRPRYPWCPRRIPGRASARARRCHLFPVGMTVRRRSHDEKMTTRLNMTVV